MASVTFLIAIALLTVGANSYLLSQLKDHFTGSFNPSGNRQVKNSRYSSKAKGDLTQICDYKDYTCMGKSLAYVSKCDPCVFGGFPNNFTSFNFYLESFFFNASALARYQIFQNIDNCYVNAFDYDSKEDILLYAVTCPKLNLISSLRLTQHLPGQIEERHNLDFTLEGDVMLTINFRKVKIGRLDLCDAFTSADLLETPVLGIYPITAADKKYVVEQLVPLLIYQPVLVEELMAYYGPVVMSMFTNAFICNFGCYLSY